MGKRINLQCLFLLVLTLRSFAGKCEPPKKADGKLLLLPWGGKVKEEESCFISGVDWLLERSF